MKRKLKQWIISGLKSLKTKTFADDNNLFFFQFLHDKVSVLDLSESNISNVGLAHISRCSNLRKLDLNSAKASRTEVSSSGKISYLCSEKFVVDLYIYSQRL